MDIIDQNVNFKTITEKDEIILYDTHYEIIPYNHRDISNKTLKEQDINNENTNNEIVNNEITNNEKISDNIVFLEDNYILFLEDNYIVFLEDN